MALGDFPFARVHALGGNLARQVFQTDLTVSVHQDEQRICLLVLQDQRFDNVVPRHTQLPRELCATAMLDVIVSVFAKTHAALTKERRGWSLRGCSFRPIRDSQVALVYFAGVSSGGK